MGKKWTKWKKWEDAKLENFYFKEGGKGCHIRLLHRTEGAIHKRAQILGLKGNKSRSGLGRFKRTEIKIFGRWESVEFNLEKSVQEGESYYKCKCKCGRVRFVRRFQLTKKNPTLSCGCLRDEKTLKRARQKIEDIVGKRFERGTVQSYNERFSKERNRSYWNVKCDCGNVYVAEAGNLKNKHTKSCGCLLLDQIGENHPNWKEEKDCISSLVMRYYKSTEYRRMQDKVFKRDNYCCIIKGNISRKDCQLHHKIPRRIPWNKYGLKTWEDVLSCKELWDLDNMVTISEEWHLGIKTYNSKAFHRMYGTRNSTIQDFEAWLKNSP